MTARADKAQTDVDGEVVGDTSDRLATYIEKTENPLDLLALLTLWIVVVPPGDFGGHHGTAIAWFVRIGVSVVYGIDLAIRCTLADRRVHYFVTHPLAIASVLVPPVRVIFSVRLVRSIFRRGNLRRFLIAASVMVLNGALIVFLYERHAAHSNIHTLGDAVWWSFVTVTTVGYGDFYPVTPQGRITACGIMAIGILTLAVVTAQVASSFVAQGSSAAPSSGATPRTGATPGTGAVPSTGATQRPRVEVVDDDAAQSELEQRLARIEALLTELSERAS